jgi:uncharacterized protein (TIGR00297 family)
VQYLGVSVLTPLMQNSLILAGILSLAISLLAWWMQALSVSGALAAFVIGLLVFGQGGIAWAAVLLTFFISSSLLTKAFSGRKAVVAEKFSKGSRRDWGQVLANGGLGAILVLVWYQSGKPLWIWAMFVGAMAAVNADTWSTELGVLSSRLPRRITTGTQVEIGTSGGVTFFGYLAAAGGALLVGAVAGLFSPTLNPLLFGLVITVAGLAGSTFDSMLGDTIQAIYFCPVCQKETERHPLHRCGTPTTRLRGWRWLNNDWINFFCSLVGALAALLMYSIIWS